MARTTARHSVARRDPGRLWLHQRQRNSVLWNLAGPALPSSSSPFYCVRACGGSRDAARISSPGRPSSCSKQILHRLGMLSRAHKHLGIARWRTSCATPRTSARRMPGSGARDAPPPGAKHQRDAPQTSVSGFLMAPCPLSSPLSCGSARGITCSSNLVTTPATSAGPFSCAER
jgi:hypothetical protein